MNCDHAVRRKTAIFTRPCLRTGIYTCSVNFECIVSTNCLGCALESLKLDGNKAGDQAITAVLRALQRHQPPISHLGISDNRLTIKTMQVRGDAINPIQQTKADACDEVTALYISLRYFKCCSMKIRDKEPAR